MRTASITLAVAFFAHALPVAAQEDIGPKTGTVGVEAPIGAGGSLLRFRTPTVATVLTISAQLVREEVDDPSAPPSFSQNLFFGEVRIGRRKYRSADQRVRPYSTLSALVGFEDFSFRSGWRFGGAFETGAAYFFSPHVSLAATSDFTLTYQIVDQEGFGSPPTKSKIIAASFSGFRLMGAVYF